MKDIMGKESLENKENRIDYKRSISGKGVERLLIISKEVKVSVQPIQSNRIRMWLQGEADSKVILKCEKRGEERVIMLQEKKVVEKVELKIAIPTTIPYLSIGTGSANVKVRNILPDELSIKTNNGLVDINTLDIDKESNIKINTKDADIQLQIRGHIELDSKSTTGVTRNRHKTNGEATVKIQARSISGDINVL